MQVMYKPWSISNEKLDTWGFEITEGKFHDTIVSITSVEIKDENNDLTVDYGLVQKTIGLNAEEFDSEFFKNTMEWVINDILKKAMDEYEDRNSSSTESSQ